MLGGEIYILMSLNCFEGRERRKPAITGRTTLPTGKSLEIFDRLQVFAMQSSGTRRTIDLTSIVQNSDISFDTTFRVTWAFFSFSFSSCGTHIEK